jgi:hypothetical protein
VADLDRGQLCLLDHRATHTFGTTDLVNDEPGRSARHDPGTGWIDAQNHAWPNSGSNAA